MIWESSNSFLLMNIMTVVFFYRESMDPSTYCVVGGWHFSVPETDPWSSARLSLAPKWQATRNTPRKRSTSSHSKLTMSTWFSNAYFSVHQVCSSWLGSNCLKTDWRIAFDMILFQYFRWKAGDVQRRRGTSTDLKRDVESCSWHKEEGCSWRGWFWKSLQDDSEKPVDFCSEEAQAVLRVCTRVWEWVGGAGWDQTLQFSQTQRILLCTLYEAPDLWLHSQRHPWRTFAWYSWILHFSLNIVLSLSVISMLYHQLCISSATLLSFNISLWD